MGSLRIFVRGTIYLPGFAFGYAAASDGCQGTTSRRSQGHLPPWIHIRGFRRSRMKVFKSLACCLFGSVLILGCATIVKHEASFSAKDFGIDEGLYDTHILPCVSASKFAASGIEQFLGGEDLGEKDCRIAMAFDSQADIDTYKKSRMLKGLSADFLDFTMPDGSTKKIEIHKYISK
ncbi:hypothetical protein BVX98_05210 [bacterium F11]|nr:hypothetical protein BVX98_05210 [bacterium F11]